MRRVAERDAEGWLTRYDGVPVVRVSYFRKTVEGMSPFWCINLKGPNGSGKSTVPLQFISHASEILFVTLSKEDKKPIATYLPEFQLLIAGTYLTQCGGCDSLGNTDAVKLILRKFWARQTHILFEGVIVGDIRSTFYELMKAFRERHPREISFCFMGTKFTECLARIQRRNGGKEINTELVKAKYKNCVAHLTYYLEQGDVDCQVLKTAGPIPKVFSRFTDLYPALQPVF